MSGNLTDLRAGVYRHWKGPLYLVLGYGHDANAEDLFAMLEDKVYPPGLKRLGQRDVVVYIGLELDEAHSGPRLAVRTVDDFFCLVCTMHNGLIWNSPEHEARTVAERKEGILDETKHQDLEGTIVPRFTYLGPEYHPGYSRSTR